MNCAGHRCLRFCDPGICLRFYRAWGSAFPLLCSSVKICTMFVLVINYSMSVLYCTVPGMHSSLSFVFGLFFFLFSGQRKRNRNHPLLTAERRPHGQSTGGHSLAVHSLRRDIEAVYWFTATSFIADRASAAATPGKGGTLFSPAPSRRAT